MTVGQEIGHTFIFALFVCFDPHRVFVDHRMLYIFIRLWTLETFDYCIFGIVYQKMVYIVKIVQNCQIY